jgi:hypothetical protein
MTERSGGGRPAAQALGRILWAAPIHPILFCLYPVASLLAWNIQELYAGQAIRSVLVTFAGCLLLWGLLTIILRDVQLAAILTSLTGLMFFSYGHVYDALGQLRGAGAQFARHRYLLLVWVAVFLAVLAFLARKRGSGRSITPILNVVGLAALLMPLVSLGTFYFRARTDDGRATRIPAVVLRPPTDEPSPDIYYIILDGYARSDTMAEAIGLDNSEFIAFLERQGFYVAAESRSNHNWTSLSIASSLNLTLAQYLGANMLPGYYPTPFIDFIRHSLVRRSLEEIGYRTIGLQSGYLPTEWIDSDAYLGPATDSLPSQGTGFRPNAFESMLLDTTLLQPVLSWPAFGFELKVTPTRNESYPYDILRAIILSEFDYLAQPLPLEGPRLVFAHIVAPHRPYLFTPTGEPRNPDEPFTLVEADDVSASDKGLYRDQAAYVTGRIQDVLHSILSNSDVPPVIILQADHGPGLGMGQPERTAILNAVLLREDCRSMLYPSITPVNTFRVIFNCYFEARLPLVEDEVYWSKWPRESAYEFLLLSP